MLALGKKPCGRHDSKTEHQHETETWLGCPDLLQSLDMKLHAPPHPLPSALPIVRMRMFCPQKQTELSDTGVSPNGEQQALLTDL